MLRIHLSRSSEGIMATPSVPFPVGLIARCTFFLSKSPTRLRRSCSAQVSQLATRAGRPRGSADIVCSNTSDSAVGVERFRNFLDLTSIDTPHLIIALGESVSGRKAGCRHRRSKKKWNYDQWVFLAKDLLHRGDRW